MAKKRSGRALFGALLALLVVLGGAWWFRDRLSGLWGGGEVVEVSPEAAAQAEAKLERLREEGEPVNLSSTELSSLLRYRSPAWAANTVSEPSVALSGDTLVVSGVVPTDHLPSHPELDRIRPVLPDSSRFEITGQVTPLESGRAALEVAEVEFAGIPIPKRYYPAVLERIGRRDEPGLAPTALAVRLPPGVGSARIQDGELILAP